MRGIHSFGSGLSLGLTTGAAVVTFALLLWTVVQPCLAQSPGQTTFQSPEQASRALFAAVQRRDEQSLTRILGAGTELLSSDDNAQDTLDRERFVQKYEQMHRLVQDPGGIAVLYVGAENWPFPIPLETRNGVWQFDSDGGAKEIRFRRIGENEVTAIGICHALVAAESRPGADDEANSLIKMVFPDVQNAKQPTPFHGYYYRILSTSGGRFVAIAYPAVYRSSGVMTFVVDHNDNVYEKDLGASSAKVASAMTSYHLDSTWAPAEFRP